MTTKFALKRLKKKDDPEFFQQAKKDFYVQSSKHNELGLKVNNTQQMKEIQIFDTFADAEKFEKRFFTEGNYIIVMVKGGKEIAWTLGQFLSHYEWDGELVINGYNFDMTCSLCCSATDFSNEAYEIYGDVLKSNIINIENGYIYTVSEALTDNVSEEGHNFLNAIAGYIAQSKYDLYFPKKRE